MTILPNRDCRAVKETRALDIEHVRELGDNHLPSRTYPLDRPPHGLPPSRPPRLSRTCLYVRRRDGGTIATKIDPVKQAPVPAISGEDLLARLHRQRSTQGRGQERLQCTVRPHGPAAVDRALQGGRGRARTARSGWGGRLPRHAYAGGNRRWLDLTIDPKSLRF